MTAEQIRNASEQKTLYLITFVVVLLVRIANLIANQVQGGDGIILFTEIVFSLGVLLAIIQTWRFCRSIGIGHPMSVVNALLCPFIFLIQVVVLLRMYSRRTGVKLGFFLGDKLPERRAARPA